MKYEYRIEWGLSLRFNNRLFTKNQRRIKKKLNHDDVTHIHIHSHKCGNCNWKSHSQTNPYINAFRFFYAQLLPTKLVQNASTNKNDVDSKWQPKRICTIKTLYYFLHHVKIYVDWSIRNGIFACIETENCKIPAIKIDVHVHQGNCCDFFCVCIKNVSHCTVLFNFVNTNCDGK